MPICLFRKNDVPPYWCSFTPSPFNNLLSISLLEFYFHFSTIHMIMSICRERRDNELRLTYFTESELSEESNFLRARIAELERIKRTKPSAANGITNVDSLENSFDEFAQLAVQNEKKPKDNCPQMDDNLLKNSLALLKKQLDGNESKVNNLENELKELMQKQTDTSEQQETDKAQLLAKIDEKNAQQKTMEYLNKTNERLKATAYYYRHSKAALDEVQKRIAVMEVIVGLLIFLLIVISPFAYYFSF
ncbi:hypothetical protein niasHT_009038 [Heterodera trifolii]|uniref:Uncharacterized protein n=1 Tax=Heterodera trifolii TaxID=157864 RepID=A0ABD2M228_9BILA